MSDAYHTPVLYNESLSFLNVHPHGAYVDATLGGGGHSESILRTIGGSGRLMCFDVDDDALAHASQRLTTTGHHVEFIRSNFSRLTAELDARGVDAVDGVLFDLGVSSHQFDEPSKGFSFRADERLDMRMDRAAPLSARDVVNEYDEQRLAEIFREYGEERNARRIASAIVRMRGTRPLETTADLAAIVEQFAPAPFAVKSLARIFQAIRIEVNGELDALRQGLAGAIDKTRSGGRIVVISYHSLEDRIVKETFRDAEGRGVPTDRRVPVQQQTPAVVRVLTRKPVTATQEEIVRNPRARSAKLRAVEKL